MSYDLHQPAIYTTFGLRINISKRDFKKLSNQAKRNPGLFRVLDNGIIIRMDMVSLIFPGGVPYDDEIGTEHVTSKSPVKRIVSDNDNKPLEMFDKKKILELIEKAGMSIADFASKIGYATSTVKIFLKTNKKPSDEFIKKVMNYINSIEKAVPADEIVNEEDLSNEDQILSNAEQFEEEIE